MLACPAQAAIVLDGRLDEPEWQQAQRLSGFKTTEPYTQGEPELATAALVYSDETGLYFGVACDQPPAVERARTRGQRDQFVTGDRVNLLLDFEGTGSTAYEFTAYLGGGEKQDAVVSRQVTYNYDWDGDWDYAVSETEDQWFVEYRIPWTVAPMGAAQDGKRTLGVFVSRFVVKTGKRYSLPGNALARATFVADMRKLQVAAHDPAQFDLFPYAAGTYDALGEEHAGRAGFDLFWKPNGRHQLTATVNPDFGQVESDQLVVNFSAIPTYFQDKRPFFTENLDLFSTEVYVLYTRRIGAAPDAGPEGASDILGALKYTGASGSVAYGAIGAWEDDSSMAQGRDFYVGRARWQVSDALTLGWMGTHVERPTLQRQADANSVDLRWTLAPGVSLIAQGVVTDVEHAAPTFLDPAGTGRSGRFVLGYAPGGRLESTTYLIAKDRTYNINDAGFMSRTSEHALQNLSTWFWRDWAPDCAIQQATLFGNLLLHVNDSGETLPNSFIGTLEFVRRDTRFAGLEYDATTVGGADDLITRGNGPARLPDRHWLFPYYGSPRTGLFRYLWVGGFGTGYFADSGYWYTRVEPGLYPSEKFSLVTIAGFTQSPDEIIWQGGNLLGAFDYQEQNVSVDVNWFPLPHHDLRVKFQWLAASGGAVAAYRPDAGGNLVTTNDAVGDFSFTTTALQLRYRYELAPLSELFLVYSHGGGDALADTERNLGSALRRGLSEETDSQFLVKLRYRFALL
jgi:hypothetical protein